MKIIEICFGQKVKGTPLGKKSIFENPGYPGKLLFLNNVLHFYTIYLECI